MAGPAPTYLAKFNNYTLPGYVQRESMDSVTNIASTHGAYIDGSFAEDVGLENKMLSLTLKVWEDNYDACVEQVRLAATMLRSVRTFAPLYVQNADKHYTAMVKSITRQKEAGTSVKILEYEVQFECKPWLERDYETNLGGAITSPVTVSTEGRTLASGGYTPVYAFIGAPSANTVVTISGYTEYGEFTGYFSCSGIANITLDSEGFTALDNNGDSAVQYVIPVDFRLNVGPGTTYFDITGANWFGWSYHDRWYI